VVSVVLVLALALYPLLRFTTVPYEHSVLIKAPRARVAAFLLDHTQSPRLQPLVYTLSTAFTCECNLQIISK
jgi:hypothetical protein